jgi:hypothetical protein
MYVRSHIDTVSGNRKYIYIDENNKKYIRNKNKYYPIKKYKGVYTLQKIRGGVGDASIVVELHLYGIKDADGAVTKDAKTFNTTIDLSNIVLNTDDDDTYKNIINDKKISIYNKGVAPIDTDFTSNNINHFITIKNVKNIFKVYFKNYTREGGKFDIKPYSSFYNIIYIRNNKIDGNSTHNLEEKFLTIFSITDDEDAEDVNLPQLYTDYADLSELEKKEEEEYNKLYKSTLDKLKEIYR